MRILWRGSVGGAVESVGGEDKAGYARTAFAKVGPTPKVMPSLGEERHDQPASLRLRDYLHADRRRSCRAFPTPAAGSVPGHRNLLWGPGQRRLARHGETRPGDCRLDEGAVAVHA